MRKDPLSLRHPVVESRNASAKKIAAQLAPSNKYIEIRVNRKPRDAGWFKIPRGIRSREIRKRRNIKPKLIQSNLSVEKKGPFRLETKSGFLHSRKRALSTQTFSTELSIRLGYPFEKSRRCDRMRRSKRPVANVYEPTASLIPPPKYQGFSRVITRRVRRLPKISPVESGGVRR